MEAAPPAEQRASVEQVAQRFDVKAFTIYKWLERKKMPAHKLGRLLWRFEISEIDDRVRSSKAGNNHDERK